MSGESPMRGTLNDRRPPAPGYGIPGKRHDQDRGPLIVGDSPSVTSMDYASPLAAAARHQDWYRLQFHLAGGPAARRAPPGETLTRRGRSRATATIRADHTTRQSVRRALRITLHGCSRGRAVRNIRRSARPTRPVWLTGPTLARSR